jgi:hypothetical protein
MKYVIFITNSVYVVKGNQLEIDGMWKGKYRSTHNTKK